MNTKPQEKPPKYEFITYEAKDKSGLIRVNKGNKIVKSNIFMYLVGFVIPESVLKDKFIELNRS